MKLCKFISCSAEGRGFVTSDYLLCRVEKEVAADSKEAQQFVHTSSTISPPSLSTSSSSAPLSKTAVSETEKSSLTTSQETRGILAGCVVTGCVCVCVCVWEGGWWVVCVKNMRFSHRSKRSGLTSVLQSLSKKPKMSTLVRVKTQNPYAADHTRYTEFRLVASKESLEATIRYYSATVSRAH